jgi:Na+/pantothenate symporter
MIPAISYKMGVFIAAVVIVIYISMGGTYAHIYTNVAQGFMMLIISLVVLISGFVLFGNIFTEVPARLAEVDPNLAKGLNPTNAGYPTAIHVIGLFMAHFWWALNPQLINKATYLKTNRDIKKFILYNALFMFLFGTVVLGGSFCRILYPAGLGAAGCPATMDGAIPLYITTVFPTIMAAIFLVAIIAATMSTVDGILLYVSTVCGNTVYRELYIASKRKRGEAIDEAKVDKTTLLIMKVSVFVVGLIAAPIAFSKPANLTAMLWGAAGPIMSAVAGPLVVGLYIKNTSAKAAALGSVVGAASFIAMYFGKLIPSVYLACGIGGIVSIVFVLIGNTIFQPMEPEHVALVFNELEQD